LMLKVKHIAKSRNTVNRLGLPVSMLSLGWRNLQNLNPSVLLSVIPATGTSYPF